MASIISAGTTSGTALNLTGDTSGILQLASNNGTVGLTLDTSQNLGVGTASPASGGKLSVVSAVAQDCAQFTDNTNYTLKITSGGSAVALVTGATGSQLALGSNGSEKVRIDNSGNVGIGIVPPAYNTYNSLTVQNMSLASFSNGDNRIVGNAYYQSPNWKYQNTAPAVYQSVEAANGLFIWSRAPSGTAGTNITWTESMRIDSSGNLLVGTASATSGSRFSLVSSNNTTATYNCLFKNSSGTIVFAIDDGGNFYSGAAASSPYNNTTASTSNLVVQSGGLLQRSTSSIKYKTDVQDATHGLAELLKLRSVTYKGKTDGDTVFGGLIAEEVDEIGLKEFVTYAEDGSPDALAYGQMVSLCVKAIQEQQALITQLQADVAALKGAK
jgi:hypothetical protein